MTTLKDFFSKNKDIFQLAYGLILLILIPLLITYNTVSIINRYNKSIDVSIQRHALAIGRSINVLIKNDLDSNKSLQTKVQQLVSKNSDDFQNIEILVPDGENFKIIASANEKNIDKVSQLDYYHLAWRSEIDKGIATESLSIAASSDDKELIKEISSQGRFWLFAMPITDSDGEKKAILSLRLSSKIIDDLTSANRNYSLYILIVTILIVTLFLSIAIKLWDYVILYKKIKEVNQMKDEFMSIASHELRTPLGAIKGYTSLILEGSFGKISDKGMKKGLERIMISAERLDTLVNDLLDVSRIEQGRMKTDNKNIQAEPIIQEIISQLEVTAKQKGLKLKYEKQKNKLPLIIADNEKLKQVLINLIGNSIKYTEKGTVKITTIIKNNKLEIKIIDTGIGMSAEDQKNLFEKFHRVQNEKTCKITGTGLGLWITKKIVELMNGKIYIESMEGIGTQVTVELNVAKKSL
ncbi:HAMP domain-containing histidine kinase [Candidatus Parcubacteria bacterium]|nr:HAMP domain-containing histidine kinase [Candidatus Parcubacteria bacterium]